MKKIQMLLAAVLCFAGAANATPNPGDKTVVIVGDVLNGDGKPVAGIKLFVTNVCTNQTTEIGTDAGKGSFQYSGELCGTFILEAKADGFKSSGKVVEMGGEKLMVVSFKMEPVTASENQDKKAPAQTFNPPMNTIEKKG